MGHSKLISAEREVLADIVRLSQKLRLNGSQGGWKDFLSRTDKVFGNSLSDPAKRTREILLAFLQTFPTETQQNFDNMVGRITARKILEQYIAKFPELDFPELNLVRMTAGQLEYTKNYSFQSHNKDWKVMRIKDISKVIKSKSLIAIDCEMVGCKDGTEGLVRVCAVDRNLNVKLDTLVNPNKPIEDYRTNITDISEQDLQGITVSLSDVQKSLKKILKGSIVIGHSLHFDLQALKIDYPLVIDTTGIFKYSDLPPGASPSLNNLCKAVLGRAVREEGKPHNCLNDAKAAMELVLAKLNKGFDEPLDVSTIYVTESELAKLLVHKVPQSVPYQDLSSLFSGKHKIDANLSMKGEYYSTLVEFKSCKKAEKAFEALDGHEEKDRIGRPQKVVKYKNGMICVRKMVPQSFSNKRKLAVENGHEEVINTPQNGHGCANKKARVLTVACEHEKEVERLKGEITKRDEEISNLQKKITNLENGISKSIKLEV